jgi:hypothetical protein
VALKAKAMAGINAYIAAHNLRSDDGGFLRGVSRAQRAPQLHQAAALSRAGGGGRSSRLPSPPRPARPCAVDVMEEDGGDEDGAEGDGTAAARGSAGRAGQKRKHP